MKFLKNYKQFLDIIGKKNKLFLFFIIFLMIVQSILEALGIAMVIPIMNFLLKEDTSIIFHYLPFLENTFVNQKDNLIIFSLIFLFIFFIFKNFFLFKVVKLYYDFAYNIQTSIKNKIFSNYLNMNYAELTNVKSSNLISNLSVNCNLFSQTFTVPFMIFFSELMILISIMILLLFFNFKSFLILLLFLMLLVFLYLSFISKKLKNLGLNKQLNEDLQVKAVANAVGSIKISKIFKIQDILFKNFSIFNTITASSMSKLGWISNLPRIALELIGILGLSIIVIFLIFTNQDYESIVITISIFAVSTFKIIPSTNRIITSLQSLNFSDSIFSTLLNAVNNPLDKKNIIKKYNRKRINIKKSIILKDVSFSYPNSKKMIINKLNFKLNVGKNIGLMGESGIGKSTFMDLLLGLYKINKGKILIDNKEVNIKHHEWMHNFSYIGQDNYMFDETLLKNITLNEKKINKENLKKITKIIEVLKLDDLVNNNPDGLNMKVGERGIQLSGGQIQRIALARAIFVNKPIIIMDEPTSALDINIEKYFFDNLHRITKSTLVIVSHKFKTLRKVNTVYKFLEGGKFKKIN